MAKPGELSTKQAAFVRAYAGNGGNGLEAARTAGYAGNVGTLKSRAHTLLKMPHVAKALRELTAQRVSSDIATVDEVKARLTAILRDKEAENKDRIAAGDKLLRAGGAYIEKREVKVEGATVSFVFEDNGRGPKPTG